MATFSGRGGASISRAQAGSGLQVASSSSPNVPGLTARRSGTPPRSAHPQPLPPREHRISLVSDHGHEPAGFIPIVDATGQASTPPATPTGHHSRTSDVVELLSSARMLSSPVRSRAHRVPISVQHGYFSTTDGGKPKQNEQSRILHSYQRDARIDGKQGHLHSFAVKPLMRQLVPDSTESYVLDAQSAMNSLEGTYSQRSQAGPVGAFSQSPARRRTESTEMRWTSEHQPNLQLESAVVEGQVEEIVAIVAQLRKGLNAERRERLALAAELSTVQHKLLGAQKELDQQKTALEQERAARERAESFLRADRSERATSFRDVEAAEWKRGERRLAELEKKSSTLGKLAAEHAKDRSGLQERLQTVEKAVEAWHHSGPAELTTQLSAVRDECLGQMESMSKLLDEIAATACRMDAAEAELRLGLASEVRRREAFENDAEANRVEFERKILQQQLVVEHKQAAQAEILAELGRAMLKHGATGANSSEYVQPERRLPRVASEQKVPHLQSSMLDSEKQKQTELVGVHGLEKYRSRHRTISLASSTGAATASDSDMDFYHDTSYGGSGQSSVTSDGSSYVHEGETDFGGSSTTGFVGRDFSFSGTASTMITDDESELTQQGAAVTLQAAARGWHHRKNSPNSRTHSSAYGGRTQPRKQTKQYRKE